MSYIVNIDTTNFAIVTNDLIQIVRVEMSVYEYFIS